MEKFKVKFLPDNKTVEVSKDTTLLSAALSCGVYINSACGGDGVCGKCKVIVKSGKVLTQPGGAITLEQRKLNLYLACLTTVHSDLEVEVPQGSKLDYEELSSPELQDRLKGFFNTPEEIEPVKSGLKEDEFLRSPLTAKLFLELPVPSLEDRVSDLERLYFEIRQLGDFGAIQTGLANIRGLSELLRDSEWKVTVTIGRRNDSVEIISIEPGDTSAKNFGLVFDIGTTTISGQLVDLNSRAVLGTKAVYNKQAAFGSDVISRIIYAQEKGGLERLHNTVVEAINEMSRELIEEHAVHLNDVTCVLCTGNTTMTHLLLNIDPAYIRREPYVPTANFIPVIRAAEAGININPRGLLSCVPGVSSYVGGDTTSGLLFSGMYKEQDLSILIDIGTNGEIALGNKDFIVASAASAGPAFEGSGVANGMRASLGAIQKIKILPGSRLDFQTIGGGKPRGICGSGYIDLLAELLRAGLIDRSGRLKAGADKRIRASESGNEFVVAYKKEADTGQDIVISDADIENLKRAKAAVYSAVSILARHMAVDISKIKKIYIAGGFGICLNIENAVAIGLLPDVPREKLEFLGNSALAGACRMLLSAQAFKCAEDIACRTTYFELSVDPGYMDEYMAALFFPHTDLNRFPSAKT